MKKERSILDCLPFQSFNKSTGRGTTRDTGKERARKEGRDVMHNVYTYTSMQTEDGSEEKDGKEEREKEFSCARYKETQTNKQLLNLKITHAFSVRYIATHFSVLWASDLMGVLFPSFLRSTSSRAPPKSHSTLAYHGSAYRASAPASHIHAPCPRQISISPTHHALPSPPHIHVTQDSYASSTVAGLKGRKWKRGG